MTCKRETLYKAVLEGVMWYLPNVVVSTVMSDFETALMNALGDTLPTATPASCWFHFAQSCFRRVQKLGLVIAFSNNPEFRLVKNFIIIKFSFEVHKKFQLFAYLLPFCNSDEFPLNK